MFYNYNLFFFVKFLMDINNIKSIIDGKEIIFTGFPKTIIYG